MKDKKNEPKNNEDQRRKSSLYRPADDGHDENGDQCAWHETQSGVPVIRTKNLRNVDHQLGERTSRLRRDLSNSASMRARL